MEKVIGEEGENFNFSHASRAMNIEPDEEQIKKYDQYPDTGSFIKYLFIILSLGTLALTVYLFSNGRWILGILGIIGTLLFAFLILVFGGSKKMAYKIGLIIPAIIVNTNPIEIVAMADMRSKEDQEPVYGFLKMIINNLPNHKIEIDEKVPCVSLFGSAIKGYRRHFEPRPISWGYAEESFIPQTVAVISQEATSSDLFNNEWEMLYKIKDRFTVDVAHNTVLFFDEDLNEVNI